MPSPSGCSEPSSGPTRRPSTGTSATRTPCSPPPSTGSSAWSTSGSPADADWQDRLRLAAEGMLDVMLAHPALGAFVGTLTTGGDNELLGGRADPGRVPVSRPRRRRHAAVLRHVQQLCVVLLQRPGGLCRRRSGRERSEESLSWVADYSAVDADRYPAVSSLRERLEGTARPRRLPPRHRDHPRVGCGASCYRPLASPASPGDSSARGCGKAAVERRLESNTCTSRVLACRVWRRRSRARSSTPPRSGPCWRRSAVCGAPC